jgi:hypothetical protein
MVLAAALVMAATGFLAADTMVLRDGRRISGELVGIRNGTVEFQEWRGRESRLLRIPREEVRRVEFDDNDRPDDSREFRPPDSRPDVRSDGRPSGMREREVTVSADVAFVDTGIEVRSGQVVHFDARGTVWWGPNRKDGPEGEHNSPYNENRPIPNRPAAALIGKIGAGNGDLFFIGDEKGPMRMRASGRLFLGINDDFLKDNRGNFRVTVLY